MSTVNQPDQETCRHVWVPNSGRGGVPDFRPAQIVAGDLPVMHVACSACGTRTWFSRAQWLKLPRQGESRIQRRQRERAAAKAVEQERDYLRRLRLRRQREYERTGGTFWNGETCQARRVVVRVGTVEKPSWWCAGMEGTERAAVEVTYGGQVFFLDDEDGSGTAKITVGRGSPGYRHRSLPSDSVVVRECP